MTNQKGTNKFAMRMVAVGILITAVTFFVGQVIDVTSMEKKLDATLANLRSQCINYDTIVTADMTKSIMRLAEQITEVRRDIELSGTLPGGESLRSFAREQRISALAILNENLEPDVLYADDTFNFDDWRSTISSDAIANIMNYSKKVYCERVYHGRLYDLAAVSRFDAKGIIVGWRHQSSLLVAESRSSLDSLISGSETENGITVYITSGGVVHGTNAADMNEKKVEDIPELAELDKSELFGGLVRVKTAGGVCYGGKLRYREYTLYVCYPHSQMFSACRVLIPFMIGLYLLCCLVGYMLQVRIERRHLEEAKARIDTIKSISSIYVICFMVNLKDDRYDIIRAPSSFMEYLYGTMNLRQLAQVMCNRFVADDGREDYRKFINAETLSARLWGNTYIEHDCMGADGTWYKSIIIPDSTDENGELNSVIFVVRDVSEQKKREIEYKKQLERTTADALRANAAKTEFLRRMSHDIRTPINVIMGMTDIGDRFPDDAERQKYCREKIHSASALLLELVNDVLSLNRIDSGGLTLEKKWFDIRQCLGEVYSVIDTQALRKDIDFNITPLDAPHCHLIGSPLHVRQVIMNILSNAIKYTTNGGKITASFREVSFDGRVAVTEFECADNGIGMSREFQEKMFEPFIQEAPDEYNPYGGIGLGLAIVKKLVDKMGGTISVDSERGVGTKFTVRLPFVADDNENAQNDFSGDENGNTLPDGIRVLVAEDNELNMEIAEFILSQNGAVVTCANDGEQAVYAWQQSAVGEFSVILMDLMMPNMDGFGAAKAIRASDRADAGTVPIIAMSANDFDDDVRMCIDAGMNAHISKPIDAGKLIEIINKFVTKG